MSAPSTRPFHVLIVGGGIGGLTLAQGLKKAGVSVSVHERDRTRTDRLQGYRIHINPAGARALDECLPPELFDAFVATTGTSGGTFGFMTEQLGELLSLSPDVTGARSEDPRAGHHSVSRITLRQVLLAGLEDVVHFGRQFVKYEHEADGRITAVFADGTTATGDVLVAADGVNSRIRAQYLPHADVVQTGVVAIAGKLPLTEATRAALSPRLLGGAAFVTAPRGQAMFLASQQFDRRHVGLPGIGDDDEAARLHPGLLFDNTSDYVMWAYATRRERYPAPDAIEGLDNSGLRELALGMIHDWHPDLLRMVRESDPSSIALLPIRTSVRIDAWRPTTVTLIGDAIHSMTPFQGIGANTALRDAALLCRNLIAAHEGRTPLLTAIGDYEAEMRGYGFDAVGASLRTMRQATSGNAVALVAGRIFFRVVDALPPLKRRMFGDVGNG